MPRAKKPALKRWSEIRIGPHEIEDWAGRFGDHGIGLRTGLLVGVDIDVLDPDLAHQIERLARQRLGETLLRIGQWPKRLLMYRTEAPEPKRRVGPLEILGLGQQVVAFGIHAKTGQPYTWPLNETPLEVPLDELPPVGPDDIDGFLAEASSLLPQPQEVSSRRPRPGNQGGGTGPVRNASGLVVEGRDGWLSSIAFHAVHDALDAGESLDPAILGNRAWQRFSETADLERRCKDGRLPYGPSHAAAKIRDKLRLHLEGRLSGLSRCVRGGVLRRQRPAPPQSPTSRACS
ncbi:MAG: bifunctional DNA primase/polymerase [Pseudomonadota bacterium]